MMKDFNRHAGETRKKTAHAQLRVLVTVTIDWPDGIPFAENLARDIATGICAQHYQVDVGGAKGKIVWCDVWTDIQEDDVEFEEYSEGEGWERR